MARVLAGAVPGLDEGSAQKVAAHQDKQRDQQAAPVLPPPTLSADQLCALQEPGQQQSTAGQLFISKERSPGMHSVPCVMIDETTLLLWG